MTLGVNDSIGMGPDGTTDTEKGVEFTKQNQHKMTEETGIQSSLKEEDMKQYLERVISEAKM
jgi:hypothetical protein